MPVIHFRDDEDSYAAWLSANPDGFVFNHFGGRDGGMNIIHRASCSFLQRSMDEGRRTRNEKICSDDLDHLVAVVDRLRVDAGGWKRCGNCLPNRAASHSDVSKRIRSARSSISALPAQATFAVGRPSFTPPVRSEDFTLWRPTKELEGLDVEPRLASWDAKSHPSQLRLRTYLDRVEAAFVRQLRDPDALFYVDIDVVLASGTDLLHHHDLENYLTPIAQRLRSPAIVLARGVKRHPEHSADHSRVTLGQVEPGARFESWNFRAVRMVGPTGSNTWKETLRQELIGTNVENAAEGPLAMVIAWRSNRRPTSWWNAWKGTGDALGPILGEPIPENPFNPADDRIVRLEMHYNSSPDLRGETHLGIWWQVVGEQRSGR